MHGAWNRQKRPLNYTSTVSKRVINPQLKLALKQMQIMQPAGIDIGVDRVLYFIGPVETYKEIIKINAKAGARIYGQVLVELVKTNFRAIQFRISQVVAGPYFPHI